jgi:hypothetical protein
VSEVSYSYPCIYGLRERCEAVEFAFRLFTGELRRQLDLLLKIGEEKEPKSDEERVVARMMKAVERFLPKYLVQASGRDADVALVNIIMMMCEKCPHRLNALKREEYATPGAGYVVVPVPRPSPPPPPPTDATGEKGGERA